MIKRQLIFLFTLLATFATILAIPPERIALSQYIDRNIGQSVRYQPHDEGFNIALPKPYSVPAIRGAFQEMYYWDTYFTNLGLICDGDLRQVRNNIENIAYLIGKYGYMPNGSHIYELNRSQPPYFSQMVRDYYDVSGDKAFLSSMIEPLENEYDFWMTKRVASNGLNHYGHSATDAELRDFFHGISGRMSYNPADFSPEEQLLYGAHLLAEAESGWDFNPRYDMRCMDFNPVDLNSLMYGFETNMAFFYKELGKNGADKWTEKAQSRADKMRKYMIDKDSGLYFDYDFVNDKRSPIFSSAVFWPLWMGVATEGDAAALKANLGRLEAAHGINAIEPGPRKLKYQWDAPNGWSAIIYAAVAGLDRYGYKDDATRVAEKYVDSLAKLYMKTGQLWEKYNAEKGDGSSGAEYPTPGNFMGWTAGVYQNFYHRLYGRPHPDSTPRVVNIVNFIRLTEPRRTLEPSLSHVTDSLLLATTRSQLEMMKDYGVPGTFLVQYDALDNPEYQKLLRSAPEDIEIGCWYEITEPHVKAAGMKWRGRYPWDWHSNVGFSVGYTPKEREKLVDAYMKKFKQIFGKYPISVGSWFIDAHTLDYMQRKYGVRTAAVCRDQIGTDGYNLWGGYWQGAYYPSKNNFFVPAADKSGQIDIATFRMLGSDPIEQYDSGMGGRHQGVYTLEPVYGSCGGNPSWVNWYLSTITASPAMTLAYAQAGQENMFTWDAMKKGFEQQMSRLSALAERGDLRLETLGQSGEWFHSNFPCTPPSMVSSIEPYQDKDKRTVWFNSRNYRLNVLQTGDTVYVRDIHLFNQNQPERYLKERSTTPEAFYATLPVVDGNCWGSSDKRAGLFFYDFRGKMLRFGPMDVSEDGSAVTVTAPVLGEKSSLIIKADENGTTFSIPGCKGWYARLDCAKEAKLPFKSLDGKKIEAEFEQFPYNFDIEYATVGKDMIIRPVGNEFKFVPAASCGITPIDLSCEHMKDPSLIDGLMPRLSWINKATTDDNTALSQSAYRLVISSSESKLDKGDYDVYDSGVVHSPDSYLVTPDYKEPLKPESTYYWKVMVWDGKDVPSAWSPKARFSTAMNHCNAKWLGGRHLKKDFDLDKALASARIYISAMGYYDLEINGKKIGTDRLSPNFSNYTYREDLERRQLAIDNEFSGYRIYYLAYDVDTVLTPGVNNIDVKIGDGFARTSAVWDSSFGEPRFLCRLVLDYTDGTSSEIISDETWQSGLSPIVMDGVFEGETYDANVTDMQWQPVTVLEPPLGKLMPQMAPADKVTATYTPLALEKRGNGKWLATFPEEISGHVRLDGVDASKGDTIDVKYLSEIKQGVQRYISDGKPAYYAPRFTWFVFSQAEISGVDSLDASQIVAESVNTDVPVKGSFSCSDNRLEKLLSIWERSQTDNLHGGVASDCPHRERSAYTGDGQVAMDAVMTYYDAPAFYRKWLGDMRDAQNPRTGYVPNGAPWQPGCGGGVAWGAAMDIMPWEYYMYYGDPQVLQENYEAMRRQLDYMKTWLTDDGTMYARRPNKGASNNPFYWLNLGEWCAPGGLPSDELVHTYFCYKCADCTAKAARALHLDTDAVALEAFRDSVGAAFHKKFYDPAEKSYGKYGSNIYALDMGVPADRLEDVKATVVRQYKDENKGHLDTGIFATRLLFETLARYGLNDLAYEIMTAEGFPGFMNWLERGAKATWEQWDGNNSRNHPMFGGGLTWFATTLAGIRPDASKPGFRHFTIAPVKTTGIDKVHCSQPTPYGDIVVDIDYGTGMTIDVPVGTCATVLLPWNQTIVDIPAGHYTFKDVQFATFGTSY